MQQYSAALTSSLSFPSLLPLFPCFNHRKALAWDSFDTVGSVSAFPSFGTVHAGGFVQWLLLTPWLIIPECHSTIHAPPRALIKRNA